MHAWALELKYCNEIKNIESDNNTRLMEVNMDTLQDIINNSKHYKNLLQYIKDFLTRAFEENYSIPPNTGK